MKSASTTASEGPDGTVSQRRPDPAGMACPSSPALVDLPSGYLTDGLPSNNSQNLYNYWTTGKYLGLINLKVIPAGYD